MIDNPICQLENVFRPIHFTFRKHLENFSISVTFKFNSDFKTL